MSTWCCQWFNCLIDETGEKGFSIIAFRDSSYRTFYLQARPFEKEIVAEFEINVPEIKVLSGKLVPITISQQIPLTFCPRCGANLDKIIKKNIIEFDKLADLHFPYRD